MQLFKFSRRPELRRSSFWLLHQTWITRQSRNSFACSVVNHWNRLSPADASVPEHRTFKEQLDLHVHQLLIICWPQYVLLGRYIPSRSFDTYIHTFVRFVMANNLKSISSFEHAQGQRIRWFNNRRQYKESSKRFSLQLLKGCRIRGPSDELQLFSEGNETCLG